MNDDNNLDDQFEKSLNHINICNIFENLLEKKTDLLHGETRIAIGCDNIDFLKFKENIESYSKIICEKGKTGNYIFNPFREVAIPKPPYEKDQLEEAKKADKIRTLSISTIQDTLFQELMIRVMTPRVEEKFKDIDSNSFAYRKDKSSKMAVRKIINYVDDGYLHVLDGDIEKFFDEIDHTLLFEKVKTFFGSNKLIIKYIYRFMNVKQIPDGSWSDYQQNKNIAQKRLKGIPQGGVLSGLLANLFLYDFDMYITKELSKDYDFKYIRYADDFVLMFKSDNDIIKIYELLKKFLENEKLVLHPLGEKTKYLDLSDKKRDTLEFLGFAISPKTLKIKSANITKFLHRICVIIEDIDAVDTDSYLSRVVSQIRPKIIGLEDLLTDDNGVCAECKNILAQRNWIGYFMVVDDVRMLRNIDTSIRKIIYEDFHSKTKKHLKKKEFLQIKKMLLSVEKVYYKYKKQEILVKKGKLSYCKCERYFDTKENRIITVKQDKLAKATSG